MVPILWPGCNWKLWKIFFPALPPSPGRFHIALVLANTVIAHCVLLLLLSGGLAAGGGALAWRLRLEPERGSGWPWLVPWCFKGLVLPALVWLLMNLGLSPTIPPFMPQIQAAQLRGGSWATAFFRAFAGGVFVICSYWAAVTLVWALGRKLPRLHPEQRLELRSLAGTSCLGMIVPAALLAIFGGWPLVGLAVAMLTVPIVGYAPTLLSPRPRAPIYSGAVARIKFGKYQDAEWEILRELENCENDFEGWLMLADLYANHFHDLQEAEQTIMEICDHPATNQSQFSVALHRLADWHLKLAHDPEAARRALQIICDRLPDTHLARMAENRIRQLPTRAALLEQLHAPHRIHLPARSAPRDSNLTGPPG